MANFVQYVFFVDKLSSAGALYWPNHQIQGLSPPLAEGNVLKIGYDSSVLTIELSHFYYANLQVFIG